MQRQRPRYSRFRRFKSSNSRLVSLPNDYVILDRHGITSECCRRVGGGCDSDRCGRVTGALRPLADLIRDLVVSSDRIHADDTPIQVLDPKKKQIEGLARVVREGRIGVDVRDGLGVVRVSRRNDRMGGLERKDAGGAHGWAVTRPLPSTGSPPTTGARNGTSISYRLPPFRKR
jgi:hypothetical protein